MSEISLLTKEIPQSVITEATTAFQNGFDVLKPYLQAMTMEDRKSLFKMADGSEPFANKTVDYAGLNPQFVPAYMSVDNLSIGLKVYAQLTPLCNLLAEVSSLTCDTRMLAGAQAMREALKFYHQLQTSVNNRVAGAKAIFDDLRKRFARKRSRKEMEAA